MFGTLVSDILITLTTNSRGQLNPKSVRSFLQIWAVTGPSLRPDQPAPVPAETSTASLISLEALSPRLGCC